jgi:hypothetical protein
MTAASRAAAIPARFVEAFALLIGDALRLMDRCRGDVAAIFALQEVAA